MSELLIYQDNQDKTTLDEDIQKQLEEIELAECQLRNLKNRKEQINIDESDPTYCAKI